MMTSNLTSHFSFSGMQEQGQKLSKDSQDVAKLALDVNSDRRSQISDDNPGHFHRQPNAPSALEYEPVHANVTLLKAELKAITNDRDILRRELSKMQNQLENYKQLGYSGGVEKAPQNHSYEWLKSQCDQAMSELQSLREQHSDTVKKCDSAMNRADLYKQQYEKVKDSNTVMRSQYVEVMADKQHLEDERQELRRLTEADRREIDELRKQQREVIGQGTSLEEFSVVYDKLVNRYDLLKKDYETLKKQYNESVSAVGATSTKVEALQEENLRLRKQNSTLYDDKKSLQQHLSQNLVSFGLEKKSLVHELTKTQQEKEAIEQRLSQMLAEKLKEMKDLSRIRNERNEAYKEYKLVMSERDTVHKEIEQLQDVISELNGKVATLVGEKSSALNEVARLRQMLRNAHDNFGDASEVRSLELEQEKILHDFDQMLERTSSERESFNPYSSNNKAEVLGVFSRDNSAKELDNLRKDLEKAQNELMDAVHDLEEAKQQRDWAFGERDKIVKERESIRTLCDKVRHERDSAVSELIDALRDSDELKRQKSDVMKELKDIKEKYEALAEKEAQGNRLSVIECSHSRDSAIDADLQEWETETLELEIGKMHSSDLGFDLVGGTSDPQFPNDPSVFVRNVQPNSTAFGKLKVSDQLLRINDIDVSSADKAFICQILRNSPDPVNIVVRRRKLTSSRAIFPIHLYRSGDRDIGISLEQGLYVNRLMSGSLAAKEGNLAVGDRILNINGFSLENCSALKAVQMLSEAGDHIVLNVLRYCQTPTPSLVSSASMFSGTNFDAYSDGGGFRSPHDLSWKSPPNELNSCADGKTVALRSSSSQTDGLDSAGFADSRIGGFEWGQGNSSIKKSVYDGGMDGLMPEKNIFDKAMNVIARPFRSSRAVRDVRSKSTHPFVNASVIESWRRQDEVGSENPFPAKLVDTPPSPSTAAKLKRKSHGTWPKCRMHFDYTAPSELAASSATERPQLSQVVRGGSSALPSGSTEHKIPPLPPTRSDSIKRSASVKHSPQNSDSTMKYSSMKSSINSTIQRLDRVAGDAFHGSDANQSFLIDSRPSVAMTGQPQDFAYHESTPADRRSVSPGTISYNPVNDLQTMWHVGPNPGPRVGNVQHRSDRRSQDFSQHSGDLWTFERLPQAQKPTSLDVHPIYSSHPNRNHEVNLSWMSGFDPEANLSSAKSSVGDAHQRMMMRNVPWASKKTNELPMPIMSASPVADQTVSYFSHLSNTVQPMGPSSMRRSPVSPISSMPLGRSIGPSIPETPDLELSSSSNKDDSQASSSPSPMVSSLYHRFHPPVSAVKFPLQTNELSGELLSLFSQRSGNQFHERIRIPSSPSIMSSRSSGGAISSPSSYDAITDYLSSVAPYTLPNRSRRHPPVTASNSLPKMISQDKLSRARPCLGDTRNITVEITNQNLGICIASSRGGGIFVSFVGENSAAARAGVEIGDQLLEVCGINMRNATRHNAARVLRQCVGTVEMLVQYNPNKYREHNFTDSDDPSEDDNVSEKAHDNFNRGSGSNRARASNATITPETFMTHATFSHCSVNADEPSASAESHVIVRKKLHLHDSLGLELVGGNVIGIFIKHVLPGSIMGGPKGVRIGDQILEFNNKDFHGLTLEQAILEIGKPCDQVIFRVQYNFPLFLRTESQSGDGFYVQALYNRQATSSSELSFKRGDILFIENTVLNSRIGTWWAYLVNENGDKLKCGTIPSKVKLEEELSHRRSLVDVSSCQATGTVRRSFFQRHRHHHGSKDSHDLNVFSDLSPNSDSLHNVEDLLPPTLERIQKFDSSILRPVVIIGAFAEQIVKKLTSESPDKFCKYDTDMMISNEDSNVIEYRPSADGMYKVISISIVQKIMNQHRHCLLAVPPEVVEKLQKTNIYPIVLFIKYKSQKQIREVKDTCFIPEKVSSKMAKDLFEQNQDYEHKFKRLFAEMIPGGNLALMCCQIKLVIDKEQKKTLWVPSADFS